MPRKRKVGHVHFVDRMHDQWLLDALPWAAAVLNESGTPANVNTAWREMFAESERLDDPLSSRLLAAAIKDVLNGSQSSSTPIVHQHRGVWLETRITRLAAVGSGALVTHQDISEFRGQQHQLRQVLDATNGVVGHALLRAVARQLKHFAKSRYALVGSLVGDEVHTAVFLDGENVAPNFSFPLRGSVCETVLGKAPVVMLRTGARARFPKMEFLHGAKIEGFLAVPLSDPSGGPLGVICAASDTALEVPIDTQLLAVLATRAGAELSRVRAEGALRESQERLALALVGTDDGVFDWNVVTGALHGNARLTAMIGFSAQELMTVQQWQQLIHSEDLPRVRAALKEHLRGQTALLNVELRVKAKDGSWKWVQQRGKVVERDEAGRAVRMTGMHTDISDKKRLEVQVQVAERMASVGALAASLAHEMNTPLAYLTHGLEAMAQSADPSSQKEAFDMVREGAARIREVVRDVKAFSRVDVAALKAPVDVREVLMRAIRLARREVVQRGRLVEELGSVPLVHANDSQLAHVFLNLLINAAQALPLGSAAAHQVRAVTRTDESGWAVVEIFDSGKGISAEVAPHIFDPFYTTKPAGEGTGLGLAICQEVVTALQGEITFHTEPGQTCFRVRLPPSKEAAAVQLLQEAPTSPSARRRLLVVDDHPAMGASLRLMLRGEHDVDCVTDAASALELLKRTPYDLVLCDLMMPGITGMDLYRMVRSEFPSLADRFVFMTGGATSVPAARFLEEFHRRVLEKPFKPEALQALLS